MKSFITCYIVELSGDGKTENAKLEHLKHSSDEFMETMLSYFDDLTIPQAETITIRVGRVSCNEKKNIKEHLCLKKIILKPLDK